MKLFLYAFIFLLILSLSKCKECDCSATSYSDCKSLDVSSGMKCCYSIFAFTYKGEYKELKRCEEIDDENSAKQKRETKYNNMGAKVNKNYYDCGQTNDNNDTCNIKIYLFSLMLLLLF